MKLTTMTKLASLASHWRRKSNEAKTQLKFDDGPDYSQLETEYRVFKACADELERELKTMTEES